MSASELEAELAMQVWQVLNVWVERNAREA